MEIEQIPEEQGHKKGRHRKKQLYNSILQLMEFYFSDSNLTKDRFLSQMIQSDPNIEISVFLKFNKLRKLTTNIEDITKAISKSQLIELSEDKTRVRRKLPIKVKQDVDECTIYVERLKSDATHDWLKSIFSEFGNVVYISIPKYKHNGMIKGFAFVEFEHAEGANVAMQYFETIDCKIPSDIEPQKLCSIVSFDRYDKNVCAKASKIREEMDEDGQTEQENSIEVEEITNKNNQETEKADKSEEDVKITKKRKHSKSETNEDEQPKTSDKLEKKKMNIQDKSETIEGVQQEILPQKKRNHSETETNEDVLQEVSGGEEEKLKVEDKSETIEGVQQEILPQKKRKRRETETNDDVLQEVSGGEEEKLKIEDKSETIEGVQQEILPQKKRKHSETETNEDVLQEVSGGGEEKLKVEDKSETIEGVQQEILPQKKRKHSETETNEDVLQEVSGGEEEKLKLEDKSETIEGVQQEILTQKKRKHSETETNEDVLQEVSGGEEEKLKIEDKSETIESVQQEILPQKKRKHSETETNEDVLQEVSGREEKKLKINDRPEINKNLQPDTISDGEAEEKKKKKHKKSNRKKVNLKEIGLQILSKKDWKRMRNRYLQMQRKTMKELKMHLNKQRFGNRYLPKKFRTEGENSEMEVKENHTPKENDTAKEESQFIPGTIVKVSLLEPCENNKKLKTEFKEISPEIKYVDIPWKVGSEEVFVRFSDNKNAQAFCTSNFSKGKSCILEGDEEKIYWEKIDASRQEKQKKMVGKQRGRDKLLKKAERQAAKHVRFDDNDSE